MESLYAVNSPKPGIEIDDAEAARIRRARADVIGLLHVEEKFGYVFENYSELEMEVARVTLGSALGRLHQTHDDLHHVTRRLCNFLSTARMYLDQVPQNLNAIGAAFAGDAFKEETSRAYDASIAYQLMEGMRNYAQHRDFPMDVLKTGGAWTGQEPTDKCVHQANLMINLPALRGDVIKRPVLDSAIAAFGEDVDLLAIGREYFAYLSRIQNAVRENVEPHVKAQLAVVQDAIERTVKHLDGEAWAIVVEKEEADRLFLHGAVKLNERREKLGHGRYRGNESAHRHIVVSGELPK